MTFQLGQLTAVPAVDRLDLLAPTTAESVDVLGLQTRIGVVEIDATLSDTAACQEAYALPPDSLANCVVVGGKREGRERIAACLVLATTRADINNTVRRLLDVRKASFLPMERAVELTGMEYGGITPIGLPDDWPVFVDRAVVEQPILIVGSGVRRSKLLVPGPVFEELPRARIVDGLGI